MVLYQGRTPGIIYPFRLQGERLQERFAAQLQALHARMRRERIRFAVAPMVKVETRRGWVGECQPVTVEDFETLSALIRHIEEGRVVEVFIPDTDPPPQAA